MFGTLRSIRVSFQLFFYVFVQVILELFHGTGQACYRHMHKDLDHPVTLPKPSNRARSDGHEKERKGRFLLKSQLCTRHYAAGSVRDISIIPAGVYGDFFGNFFFGLGRVFLFFFLSIRAHGLRLVLIILSTTLVSFAHFNVLFVLQLHC